ncbi:PEP-CTERM sorting domain-containing protein [Planctomycetota bacterium]|nr:PEP-CTERM sorting domain-containing protein [Planctomycetota bacterium]
MGTAANAGGLNVDFAADYAEGDLETVSGGEFTHAHNGYLYGGVEYNTSGSYAFNVTPDGVSTGLTSSGGPAYQANSTADFVDGKVSMTINMDWISQSGFISVFARNDEAAMRCVNGRMYVKKHDNGATQYFLGINNTNIVWNAMEFAAYEDKFSFVPPIDEFQGMPLNFELDLNGDQATFSVGYDWTGKSGTHYQATHSVSGTIDDASLLDAGTAGFAYFQNEPGSEDFSTNIGGHIQNFAVTPIPEPASLALLGLGGLAMMRRRR